MGIRPDALLRPFLFEVGEGVLSRDSSPIFSLSDDWDGLRTEYVEPRVVLPWRGATEGSRYRESTVEARVWGVADRWVLRRAMLDVPVRANELECGGVV